MILFWVAKIGQIFVVYIFKLHSFTIYFQGSNPHLDPYILMFVGKRLIFFGWGMVTLNSCGTSSFWLFVRKFPSPIFAAVFPWCCALPFFLSGHWPWGSWDDTWNAPKQTSIHRKIRGFHKWDPMGVSIYTHTYMYMYIYISYIIDLIGMDKGYPHGLETSIYDMMRFWSTESWSTSHHPPPGSVQKHYCMFTNNFDGNFSRWTCFFDW